MLITMGLLILAGNTWYDLKGKPHAHWLMLKLSNISTAHNLDDFKVAARK